MSAPGRPADGGRSTPEDGLGATRVERPLHRRLGAVFLCLGALVLLLIGVTIETFARLAEDSRREEIARAQESSVFQLQLLLMARLRGEHPVEEIRARCAVVEARNASLRALAEHAEGPEQALADAWTTHREILTAVIRAQDGLEERADLALRAFAPWLSRLSMLESYLEPDDLDYEDHLGLLAECRMLSSTLGSSFFKLVSAPAGDDERQARLSLSVGLEALAESLQDLEQDLAEHRSHHETEAALEQALEAHAVLAERLASVVEGKEALVALAGPSGGPDLEDSFDNLLRVQQRVLRYYEASAQEQRAVVRTVLLASLPIVMVLVLAALAVVQRSIVGPLRRLTEGTARLARGELETRIRSEARDEVGALASSFNAMAASLARSQRELREWADTLEQQVAERTEALSGAHDRLVRETLERERVEEELRMAQKLEAVGQLAAGIAHEINTPIQFVGDNVRFLGGLVARATPVLAEARALATRACGQAGLEAEAGGLVQRMEEADLDYLLAEGGLAVQQALEGVERITSIVRAMKDFSHPGTHEMEDVDLRRAIESTVTVAQNEWKYVAEVELDFAGDLPLVRCLPGEINQVLLNLIVNAAHAIAEKKRGGERGKIRIRAERDGGQALIRVQDTGTGIAPELRERVFDPFFTTKPIGRGTGQGLSIAHAVVVGRHGGSIQIESEVGVGTTFLVRIPLEPALARAA